MGLFDEITKMKRHSVLMKVGQDYADMAQEFRGKYSAMLVAINGMKNHLEKVGISMELVQAMIEKINNSINAHYEAVEDLIINKGVGIDEAVEQAGAIKVEMIDIEEVEKELANGK